MKKFLTIFPQAMNVHLIKDVGMIPYVLAKELNYDATLVCYQNDTYPYLQKEVKGLKVVFLQKIFGNQFLDVLFFLFLNRKNYDVLQVYHLLRSTLVWCFFFKLFSLGKGKTYLKLDADERILNYHPSPVVKYLLQKVNLVSVENKTYLAQLNLSRQLGRNVEYITNGFYDDGKRRKVDFSKKENKIVTVGRVGTAQKATHVLCNGFAAFALNNPGWKLVIIGPIAEDFKPFIDAYFKQYPALKDRVLFKGEMKDRKLLETHYETAKIFALSSAYEGFPIVLPEAARFGCYLISTNFPAIKDIIDVDKYGSIYNVGDDLVLAKQLHKICNDQHTLEKVTEGIQDFAYSHFYWANICKQIDMHLWKV